MHLEIKSWMMRSSNRIDFFKGKKIFFMQLVFFRGDF